MGTLDDAIREHLELKKRSGAPEEEVERLEHEAFGPVRREAPAPAAPEPAAAPEPVGEAPAVAVPFEPAPEPVAPDPEPVAEAEVPPAPQEPAPPPAPREPEAWLDDDGDLDDGPQATAEFSAADVQEAQGKPQTDYVAPDEEGEDLLEETPDFLQETPEHDRLWFEQRPPRDFDFDN
jgi:hypothetical protein